MKNNKKQFNKIDLTDANEKGRALLFLILSFGAEITGIVFACLHELWGFILALIFPVFIFLTVKYYIAAVERGVYVKGDEISFEAEYKKITRINKKELKSIYINDAGNGKVEENVTRFKNVQVMFVTKDGKKHPYPLDVVSKDQLETLRKELL
ncbi:MAG: hypothetical protein E7675_03495 [Ruminococcaceae bacterium]|nr:hypothetical protein [Oscillospiraceae bacterium]